MAIYNETFDAYRTEQQKIKDSIELLKKSNYAVYSPDEIKEIELFYEDLDEWDSVFDPVEKPEYSHDQLVRFAKLWADKQLKEYKLKTEKK